MFSSKKIIFFLILIILSLVLREMPYVNVLVAGKLWIFYLVLLFLLFFFPFASYFSKTATSSALVIFTILVIFSLFLFTIFKITYFAEMIGVVFYFLLWLIVCLKMMEFFRKTRK